jgi:hypothetical protein
MSHPVQDFIAWWLSQPLFWAALGAVCGPYLFFRGFRLLQLKRLVMDVPRSSIHAAALGPVEVSGKAVGPYTVVSPFSRSNCLYYRVVKRSAGQTNIREMCAPLFLEDETGRVMVYPRGAKLQLESFDSDGKLRSALMRVAWARLNCLIFAGAQEDPIGLRSSVLSREIRFSFSVSLVKIDGRRRGKMTIEVHLPRKAQLKTTPHCLGLGQGSSAKAKRTCNRKFLT